MLVAAAADISAGNGAGAAEVVGHVQHVEAQFLRPAGGVLNLRPRPRVVQTQTEPEVFDHSPIVGSRSRCLAAATSGQPSSADFETRRPQQKDLPPDPARREISDGPDQVFTMASHPTLGVEEEFLLVDPTTGEPVAVNKAVARHAAERGVKLQLELTSCQIETTTEVVSRQRRAPSGAEPAAPDRRRSRRGQRRASCSPSRCRRPCRTSSRSPTPRATARSPRSSA